MHFSIHRIEGYIRHNKYDLVKYIFLNLSKSMEGATIIVCIQKHNDLHCINTSFVRCRDRFHSCTRLKNNILIIKNISDYAFITSDPTTSGN